MSSRNTVIRSLHDLGADAWFGGSLMGAIGVNGAANDVTDPSERPKVASAGWARWAPVNALAIGAHLRGGAGLALQHHDRIRDQAGVGANTAIKTGVTALALACTAYSGVLGARIAAAGRVPAEGGTQPGTDTPAPIAKTQQLRVLQWMTPALTATLIVLGAQQGEQQRPGQRLSSVNATLRQRAARSSYTTTP